jgi:hypothetical protein
MLQRPVVKAKNCVPVAPHTIGESVVSSIAFLRRSILSVNFGTREGGSRDELIKSVSTESATLGYLALPCKITSGGDTRLVLHLVEHQQY